MNFLHYNLQREFQPSVIDVIKSKFSSKDWKILSSIPHDKRKDATFVRALIKILYHEDLSVLSYRSLNGCSARTVKLKYGTSCYQAEKYPITPEKRLLIRNTYEDRIKKINDISDAERYSRLDEVQMNKLICSAIISVQRGMNTDDDDLANRASDSFSTEDNENRY